MNGEFKIIEYTENEEYEMELGQDRKNTNLDIYKGKIYISIF